MGTFEPIGFEMWFRALVRAGDPDSGEVRASVRDWLRRTFDEAGPIAESVLRDRFANELVLGSHTSVAVALEDVHRTTTYRPTVAVNRDGERARIAYADESGSSSGTTIESIDAIENLVEVADYLQEVVMEHVHAGWPVCVQHDVGVHAESRDGRAVWWCRLGGHPLGSIGEL